MFPIIFNKSYNKNNRVYFIQVEPPHGPIKIGVTNNVKKRLSSLQAANPYKLKVLYSCEGSYPHEKVLHKFFKKYKKRGEWFHPAEQILGAIKDKKIWDEKHAEDNQARVSW